MYKSSSGPAGPKGLDAAAAICQTVEDAGLAPLRTRHPLTDAE